MDLGIRGKTALVNGGSAGLGKGAARALAAEGVVLFIAARGEDRLLKTCREISTETGASVTPIVADHSTEAGRDSILSDCSNPDIFIATSSPAPVVDDFRDVTPGDWQNYLASGLVSPIEFIRAVIDGMCERGFGRILNISTVGAKFPVERRLLSGGPRAALSNYTAAISRKVARHNVTINNLLPGLHDTDGLRTGFTDDASKAGIAVEEAIAAYVKRRKTPAGRLGTLEEFGAICAMFCSAHAGFITGQNLVVDGGATSSTF